MELRKSVGVRAISGLHHVYGPTLSFVRIHVSVGWSAPLSLLRKHQTNIRKERVTENHQFSSFATQIMIIWT